MFITIFVKSQILDSTHEILEMIQNGGIIHPLSHFGCIFLFGQSGNLMAAQSVGYLQLEYYLEV